MFRVWKIHNFIISGLVLLWYHKNGWSMTLLMLSHSNKPKDFKNFGFQFFQVGLYLQKTKYRNKKSYIYRNEIQVHPYVIFRKGKVKIIVFWTFFIDTMIDAKLEILLKTYDDVIKIRIHAANHIVKDGECETKHFIQKQPITLKLSLSFSLYR